APSTRAPQAPQREMPRVVAAPFVAPPAPAEPAATVPEPAAPLPEPAATVREPAATVPEPAATVPEPAATVPEPVARHSRHAAPDADEPSFLSDTGRPEAVAAQELWAPPAPPEHAVDSLELAPESP